MINIEDVYNANKEVLNRYIFFNQHNWLEKIDAEQNNLDFEQHIFIAADEFDLEFDVGSGILDLDFRLFDKELVISFTKKSRWYSTDGLSIHGYNKEGTEIEFNWFDEKLM